MASFDEIKQQAEKTANAEAEPAVKAEAELGAKPEPDAKTTE